MAGIYMMTLKADWSRINEVEIDFLNRQFVLKDEWGHREPVTFTNVKKAYLEGLLKMSDLNLEFGKPEVIVSFLRPVTCSFKQGVLKCPRNIFIDVEELEEEGE